MGRLLLFSFTLFIYSASWAADCGQFRIVKGDVTYKGKSQGEFEKARINKQICQGDTVKTGADSRAKIVMADSNELNISPDSEMQIEVYDTAQADGEKKVLINVLYGKIRSNVKQKYKDDEKSHYRVKTKSAVAGVRGTEFLASFDLRTSETKIVTFEGEVNVGLLKGANIIASVSVKPGQFTSNTTGTNPHTPKEVPPQELAKIDSESAIGDAPRGVAEDSAANAKDEKKEQPKKEEIKKEEPKKVEPKQGNKDQSSNESKGSGNAPAASGSATGGSASSTGGSRDVASVGGSSGGDSLGLPPPSLNNMPGSSGNLGIIEPPKIPNMTMLNPITNQLPVCLTCNDAIINQKVKVIIIPRLPGQ